MSEGPPLNPNIVGPNKSPERNEKINLEILIADDSLIIRRLLEDMLGQRYTSVGSVENGADLVKRLSTHSNNIGIAITDFSMPPGIDGIEAIKTIRDAGNTMPIIMLTGEDSSVFKFIKSKVEAFSNTVCLSKPFNEEELYATIDRLTKKPESAK